MMKKYNIYNLKVVKIVSNDDVKHFICMYNEASDTYTEVLTNHKIKISDSSCIEPLSNYYSTLEQCNYQTGKPLMLNKKMILEKYIDINAILTPKKKTVSKTLSK